MKRGERKKTILFIACALLALLFSACGNGGGSAHAEGAEDAVLGENIYVDGLNVSGMRMGEARAALAEAHKAAAARLNFIVSVEGEEVSVNGASLPISFDTEEVLRSAGALKKHYPQNNASRSFSCAVSVDAEAMRAALHGIFSAYGIAPKNASAAFDFSEEGRFAYTPEQNGREIDVAPLAQTLKERIESLGSLTENAALSTDGGGTRFEAKVTTLFPAYTEELARADTALLSAFSTSFKGSVYGKKNRVFNIEKAAGLLNGAIVLPGGEFDMNLTLGDRNGENGWKEAAAIRDATYVQEYGGGVCQVSTTLYNAVLMADLEVTERWHHSWPLGYVGIGRDATISTGGPNFKFKNNTAAKITVCAYADKDKKKIYVELYGRKTESGVTIKLSSRKVDTLESLGEDRILDNTLPPGTREVVREARVGSVAETYKEYYDASGKLVGTALVTRDKYRSVKGIVMVSRDIYYGYAMLPEATDAP